MSKENFSVQFDEGKGRAHILLVSETFSAGDLDHLAQRIPPSGRKLTIRSAPLLEKGWKAQADELYALLVERGIRQFTGISNGETSVFFFYIALKDPKLVRSLILIEPALSSPQTLLARVANKIESFLPLGLPLRAGSGIFDVRPFLQRVRCPVLTLRIGEGEVFKESKIMQSANVHSPTAWTFWIKEVKEAGELFQRWEGIPAKCPQ